MSMLIAPRYVVVDVALGAPDDRRSAAVRNRGDPLVRAPVEQGDDVGFVAGDRDEVGRAREVAVQPPPHVAERLSVRMTRSLERIVGAEGRE